MQLARLVHALFTRFDATVRACGLFKMDTVGDAYIVAISEDCKQVNFDRDNNGAIRVWLSFPKQAVSSYFVTVVK